MRCDAPTRAARSIAMNDTQSPPKSDVQDRYFGLLRCVGCFPGVCSEDALKGIFDDHRTARRALKSADIAENSIERSWSQHHVRFTLRAVWQTRFHPLSPSNGISILQRKSPWSGSAFNQRLHVAGVAFSQAARTSVEFNRCYCAWSHAGGAGAPRAQAPHLNRRCWNIHRTIRI